MEPIERRI